MWSSSSPHSAALLLMIKSMFGISDVERDLFFLSVFTLSLNFLIHSINLLYTIYIINISVRFLHNVSFVIFYPYICTRTVKIMKIKHVLNQLKDLFQRARCAHVLPDRLVQKSDDIVFH